MANGAPQTNGVGDTVPLGLYLWVSDDDVKSLAAKDIQLTLCRRHASNKWE